jgi:hypothetical protein
MLSPALGTKGERNETTSRLCIQFIPLCNGIKHGHDVFRRHIRLNVMDLLENKAAAGEQDIQIVEHVCSYLFRRPLRQDMLGVTATSP